MKTIIFSRLKFAFIQACRAFLDNLFPEKRWEKKVHNVSENMVISFPEYIKLEEVVEDGYVGLKITEPQTYGMVFRYPQTSFEPRRRALVEAFETLSEFAETDKLPANITVGIMFDESLDKEANKEAFIVQESFDKSIPPE